MLSIWIKQAAGCFAIVAWGAAHAQQPPATLGEETVVTAGRTAQRVSEVLRAVTVITAEDIARSGQLTLAEVLRSLGGLEHVASGGPGTSSAAFIRGANAAHTLVLVDGIRLQSATTGTTAFENIPLGQIDRIEIVPGPASSLYGSDALGGVIQIFTKGRRGPPSPDISLAGGSHGTFAGRASLGTSFANTELTLSVAHNETSGFSATRPSVSFGRYNPDDDGHRNSSLGARAEHRFSADHSAGVSMLFSDGESEFDNGPGKDNRNEQKLAVVSAHLRNRFATHWESLVRMGRSRDDARSLGDGPPARFRTDQDQVTWQNTIGLGPVKLVIGAEHVKQQIETTTSYEVTERTIDSVFAALQGDLGPHGAHVTVRRDDNSQFGAPTTGSAAYGYRLSPDIRIRAAYGTAFRAPSFNDLYFPEFGNAELKSERSRNREVGLDLQKGSHRLGLTYFDNRIRDLITFVFNEETFVLRPENVSLARIRGVETSYAARIGATDLRVKATFQDPEALPTGYQLQRRARRHGSASAIHSLGNWRVGAEVVAAGERYDSANQNPSTRLGGYAVVNLLAAVSIARDWTVELRWNNVADRDYELISGFNTPGSNGLLTVRWTPRQ